MTISPKPLNSYGNYRGRFGGTKDRNKRQMHPNSLANLRPGNPPVDIPQNNGYSLTAELKHALNKQKRLEIVNSTIEGAILREPTPFRELWDRVDGKVTDTHAILGDIIIEVIYGSRHKTEDDNTD